MSERRVYFNTVQASRLLGIKRETIKSWLDAGLVKPAFRAFRHRVPVKLDGKNLRELAVISGLRKAGVSMQHVKKAAVYLKSLGHNPMSKGKFLVQTVQGRKAVFKIMPENEVIDLSRESLKDNETGQLRLFHMLPIELELERLEGKIE